MQRCISGKNFNMGDKYSVLGVLEQLDDLDFDIDDG